MHTDPSQVLTKDEQEASDRLFAELLADLDPTSPVIALNPRIAASPQGKLFPGAAAAV